MNPGRYFIPTSPYAFPIRNPNIFTRIFSSVRNINWGSLLTNANKTLNVVNQTIPLIRQTTPMFNNLRSMLQLTRAFNSETAIKNNSTKKEQPNNIITPTKKIQPSSDFSEQPNFFI